MDRRSYERRRVHESVTIQSARYGPLVTDMQDLSLGGMYLETGKDGLSQNSTVTVTFKMPEGSPHDVITLEAVVVRRSANGCGLMFVRMEHDAIGELSNALSRYNGEDAVK